MKKLLFAAGLVLSGLSAQAQWSSMTIVNHSGCNYQVRIGANYNSLDYCDYTTGALVVPAAGSPGSVVSFPTYWDWAAFNSFVFPAGAPAIPDRPTTWSSPGTAAPWGVPGCFEWKTAQVWPADPWPYPANVPHPCGPTYMAGDECGPVVRGPHTWTKDPSTGNVVIDLY